MIVENQENIQTKIIIQTEEVTLEIIYVIIYIYISTYIHMLQVRKKSPNKKKRPNI